MAGVGTAAAAKRTESLSAVVLLEEADSIWGCSPVFIGHAADKRILPIAPHRKKAARALHRTAFHTTADFAVPPPYLIHNRRKPKWLRSNPTILECNDEMARREIEGMAMRDRDR